MKMLFAIGFAVMTALSLLAWWAQPRDTARGRTELTWVTDENPLRQGQIKLFDELHPKLKANLDPGNIGLEKVIVQSLAGVGPDLFDCSDRYQLAAYVRSGVALDVTDELAKRGIDVRAGCFSGTLGVAAYEGRVYGMPTNIATDAIWFHKEMFERAGIPFPTQRVTWDELITIAKKLTVRDRNGRIVRYGLLFPWWNWRHVFAGFGAPIFSPNGTRCIVDDPKAVAAVQLMLDLVYKHHVSPTPSEEAGISSQGGFGSTDIGVFSAKRAAMALGGRWWLATLRQAKGLRLGVFESPYSSVRAFRVYGRATMINRNSKHKKEALDFLAYEASAAYNRLINEQADGISAFRRYANESGFLHDPKHPEEDSNAVWRIAAEHSIPDDVSPFIEGNVATRLLQRQIDLVQNGLKTPRQAMHDAAHDVNAEIAKAVAEDPALGARYRTLLDRRTP